MLSTNSFTGSIPLQHSNELSDITNDVKIIDISNNLFFGTLPLWLGTSKIQYSLLNVSYNKFTSFEGILAIK